MKKRIAIILAFLIALSTFGIVGAACTPPTVDEVNEALAVDVFKAIKDVYKTVTGSDMPEKVADKLNDELWTQLAKGTGYLGIATFVSDFIAKNTGIVIPAANLAIVIKAAFLIYGLI